MRMRRSFKYSALSLLVAFALVVTPMPGVDNKAFACCGVDPVVTDSTPLPDEEFCQGEEVCFTGKITGTNVSIPYYPPAPTPQDPVTMTIAITPPGGGIINCNPTLSNYTQISPTVATWDFECCFVPCEVGTYTYAKTASWTTGYPWTLTSDTVAGSFIIEDCCECPPGPLGCISGTVTDGTGAPIEGKLVRLHLLGGCAIRQIEAVITCSNGCYIFDDLPDGIYSVYMRGECVSIDSRCVEIINGSKENDMNFECED